MAETCLCLLVCFRCPAKVAPAESWNFFKMRGRNALGSASWWQRFCDCSSKIWGRMHLLSLLTMGIPHDEKFAVSRFQACRSSTQILLVANLFCKVNIYLGSLGLPQRVYKFLPTLEGGGALNSMNLLLWREEGGLDDLDLIQFQSFVIACNNFTMGL